MLQGNPILESEFTHKDGSHVKARFLLYKNSIFTIAAKYRDKRDITAFFESFSPGPFKYPASKLREDTLLGFTVSTPVFDAEEQNDINDLVLSFPDEAEGKASLAMLDFIRVAEAFNDTTGEKVSVRRIKLPEYLYFKDTSSFYKDFLYDIIEDSTFIIHSRQEGVNAKGWKIVELELRDTGSTRSITGKVFYKNGVIFQLLHNSDYTSVQSRFVKDFYSSFQPIDSFKLVNPFVRKTDVFFRDYFSKDSVNIMKALLMMDLVSFDSADLNNIRKAISLSNWSSKKYVEVKRRWIDAIGDFSSSEAVNYLQKLYFEVKDTSDFQNEILNTLLDMKTTQSFQAFKDIMLSDPPGLAGLEHISSPSNFVVNTFTRQVKGKYSRYGRRKWAPMYDTLALAGSILPPLLELLVLDDYKRAVMDLLSVAVDSGYLKKESYQTHFNQLFLEAKQILKKQLALEDKKSIDKAATTDNNQSWMNDARDAGNSSLINYAKVLMPFYGQKDVQDFFSKLLKTKDNNLKLESVLLLTRYNKPVPDSLILELAEKNNFRLRLYKGLEDIQQTARFPLKFKTQEQLSLAGLYDKLYYGTSIDTIVFLKKVKAKAGDKMGWVYFFKYRKMKDDEEWKIALAGLQPLDTNLINSFIDSRNYINELTDETLSLNDDISEVLNKLLKEKIYSLRPSAMMFYKRKNEDSFEALLPDAVKRGRYN